MNLKFYNLYIHKLILLCIYKYTLTDFVNWINVDVLSVVIGWFCFSWEAFIEYAPEVKLR